MLYIFFFSNKKYNKISKMFILYGDIRIFLVPYRIKEVYIDYFITNLIFFYTSNEKYSLNYLCDNKLEAKKEA